VTRREILLAQLYESFDEATLRQWEALFLRDGIFDTRQEAFADQRLDSPPPLMRPPVPPRRDDNADGLLQMAATGA